MSVFKHIKPEQLPLNLFNAIGNEWMLISAKDENTGKFNTMTASWGGAGVLWDGRFSSAISARSGLLMSSPKKPTLSPSAFSKEKKDGKSLISAETTPAETATR